MRRDASGWRFKSLPSSSYRAESSPATGRSSPEFPGFPTYQSARPAVLVESFRCVVGPAGTGSSPRGKQAWSDSEPPRRRCSGPKPREEAHSRMVPQPVQTSQSWSRPGRHRPTLRQVARPTRTEQRTDGTPGLFEQATTGFLTAFLRLYQLLLSPLLGPTCRFEPSCSHYAITAIRCHGPIRGGWRALRRLVRCHPFHPGGYDPVD